MRSRSRDFWSRTSTLRSPSIRPEGLIVPVVRNIESKSPRRIACGHLPAKGSGASAQYARPEDLRDFTLMLSNFGTLAGRYGIPLVVPPAVAILGAGKVREDAVVVCGQRSGASAHAAFLELRSPLHHGRRGMPLPGRSHRRSRKAGLTYEDHHVSGVPGTASQNRVRRRAVRGAAAEIDAQRGLARVSCRRTTPMSMPRTWPCREPAELARSGAFAPAVRAPAPQIARWCGCSIPPCASTASPRRTPSSRW